MNIRDLEYLVALAEHRHFRRAADSCHVSQPTLSGQIRKLEDELGVMLLERTSRKVLFTQAGLLLVEQARTVLREVKVLKEMASQQGRSHVRAAAHRPDPDRGALSAAADHPDAAQNFPETGNVPARSANPATAGATRQRQIGLRHSGIGEGNRGVYRSASVR